MNRVRLDSAKNRKPLWARNEPPRPLRTFVARAFAVAAFAATFFGLIMLGVFFGRLAVDAYAWFHTMPALIDERNQELAVLSRNTQADIEKELQKVDQFMQDEVATASSDEEKAQIRRDYEKIKAQKRKDLEVTAQEKIQNAERNTRTDTRAPALLANFFTEGPSNLPQDAGIRTALLGSVYLGLITILLAVPLGVGTAVFLEEYKTTGWLARVIQVNINNLAGVPSVLFGILGGFVFVDLIFKPLEDQNPDISARNLLGGGLTLALLTLPIIIVSAQEAIRAVPVSIRHAALALGATRWQTIWHLVLPNALPGILTGTILSLSRALGEAAALILFGANLFVSQDPSLFGRFTVLPLQIFNWTDRPQEAWRYNAAVASLVLILTLLSLNAVAIFVRYRIQRSKM